MTIKKMVEVTERLNAEAAAIELNKSDYGDMVCFCGHVRRDHGPSSELGEQFYRRDACVNCGAKLCDEFKWNGGVTTQGAN